MMPLLHSKAHALPAQRKQPRLSLYIDEYMNRGADIDVDIGNELCPINLDFKSTKKSFQGTHLASGAHPWSDQPLTSLGVVFNWDTQRKGWGYRGTSMSLSMVSNGIHGSLASGATLKDRIMALRIPKSSKVPGSPSTTVKGE